MTHRLLVVDDDQAFRALVAVSLEGLGWVVAQSGSIAEGKAALRRQDFDLVLVDGMLPDGNGRELIAWMRARALKAEPIFLSAWFRDLNTVRSLHQELGVQLVLSKPIDLVELRLAMEGVLERSVPPGQSVDADPSSLASHADAEEEPAVLTALRAVYGEKLPKQLETLTVGISELLAGKGRADELVELAHAVHGTAGTFGFTESSRVAGRVEARLRALAPGHFEGDDELYGVLGDLQGIRRRLESRPAALRGSGSPAAGPADGATAETVLVVDAHPERLEFIERMAADRMFRLLVARDEEKALALARDVPPSCAVITLDQDDGRDPFRLARRLRGLPNGDVLPVAFVSSIDSVPLRLACANAHGNLFLVAPLSAQRFIEAVRRMLVLREKGAKILMIEDDALFAEETARCLRARGFDVVVLDDATRCVDVLDTVQPDVLLLDIVMPVLSGFDVCRIVRSSDRWRELPIVMVTGRVGAHVRIAAFQAGADDYVAKPIVESELVARLSQRVLRARQSRAGRERDTLTDLLLRGAFTERFATRLAACRRRSEPLSIALLDVDNFKLVNDRNGHLIGDQVLAVLGQLVAGQVRADDLCARWGGEELAIAFVNAAADDAKRALDRIRETFAGMRFPAPDGSEFSVTFSAGIATTTGADLTLEELLSRADTLLFAAKDAGRNRVFV